VIEADPRIIYEDDELRVIYQPGASDYFLFTFGDLASLAKGKRFFADTPATKLNLNCIGFMAKSPNWFPRANMQAALACVLPLTSSYARRVVYGGSMGGYAAVKYSRSLGATEVISMCPQWSLDKSECDGVDPGWQVFFQEKMLGMGIKAEDCSGSIYIIADRFDRRDKFHAQRIAGVYPSSKLINMPLIGHHVTTVFAGTQNLAQLIEAATTENVSLMTQLAREIRKESPKRVKKLIAMAVLKKPALAHRMIVSMSKTSSRYMGIFADHGVATAQWLHGQGRGSEAIDHMQSLGQSASDLGNYWRLAFYAAALSRQDIGISNCHGGILYYDFGSGNCCATPNVELARSSLVRISIDGNELRFFLEIGGSRIYLGTDTRGNLCLSLASAEPVVTGSGTISYMQPGQVSFSFNGAYLSSRPDGRVAANRPVAKQWEMFKLTLLPKAV
jgi:hypothetical protein